MKLLRNPEIRREICSCLLLTLAMLIINLCSDVPPFLLILCCGVGALIIHLLFLAARYRAIDVLNQSLDRVLHGQDEVLTACGDEGELSILKSEIYKMTLRLKENTDALQKEKLQLVDAIADISHQLRTPLTAMNLSVSMLSSDTLSARDQLRISHELRKSLKRIDWLIDALLKLSRLDAGVVRFQKESICVKTLIERAIEPLLIIMDIKELIFDANASDEYFSGDMAWCAEALGNILKNCVEHAPPCGRIEVTARETPLFTEIIVRDSGAGFDPSDIPHLFDRFYKGKTASDESIGIGLALARSVISRHNGTIRAENHKDGGAQFTLRFYKQVI
jgi:signal transduction histidine kinase